DIVFQLADDSSIPGVIALSYKPPEPVGRPRWPGLRCRHRPLRLACGRVPTRCVSWAYTDLADLTGRDEEFCLSLLGAASKFGLPGLVEACERALVPVACVANCHPAVHAGRRAQGGSAEGPLQRIISRALVGLRSRRFLGNACTAAAGHAGIQAGLPAARGPSNSKRDDVVFLYLSRTSIKTASSVNQLDSKGEHPLGLALNLKLEGIAENLLAHTTPTSNSRDPDGFSLLHRAIRDVLQLPHRTPAGPQRTNSLPHFSITRGCDVNCEAPPTGAARCISAPPRCLDCLFSIAEQLVIKGARVNAQDADGVSPLHLAVSAGNSSVFGLLLSHPDLDANLADAAGSVPLWLTLRRVDGGPATPMARRMCAELVRKGASPDATGTRFHGDSLFAQGPDGAGGHLPVPAGAKPNTRNERGETPLHTAAHLGLAGLAKALLAAGADPNTQMTGCLQPSGESDVTMQTAIHLAICGGTGSLCRALGLQPRRCGTRDAWTWPTSLLRAGAAQRGQCEGLKPAATGACCLHSAGPLLFLMSTGADIHYVRVQASSFAIKGLQCSRGEGALPSGAPNLEHGCPLSLRLEAGQRRMAGHPIEHGASADPPGCAGPEAGQPSRHAAASSSGWRPGGSAVFLHSAAAPKSMSSRGCEDKQTSPA
uniref:ANK_REP_REGION domain-containing protein n=1 Tax=Macrostomum lignano TaxID=282301 RepID=A0A1I8JNH1_9PLAT